MLDLYFALDIPVQRYVRPRFIEKFGAVVDRTGIVRSATDVHHWDYEDAVGEEPVPFSAKEDRHLWTFINKKIRDGEGKVRKLGQMGHLTYNQIWKDYLVETRTERTRDCVSRQLAFQQIHNPSQLFPVSKKTSSPTSCRLIWKCRQKSRLCMDCTIKSMRRHWECEFLRLKTAN